LRRASPITHFAVAAAVEALGQDMKPVSEGKLRLGIVLCVMAGCVNYSGRFYGELLRDPATASPVVFPETVFNAPASHLAALLGSTGINYTLVGDPGTFLAGLSLAAGWITEQRVDGCVVIGAEERDWLVANALRLFNSKAILSEGAGALYLRAAERESRGIHLEAVTDAHSFLQSRTRLGAARGMRSELPEGHPDELLCDSTQGLSRIDAAELRVWRKWKGPRLSVKRVLGEGLAAASAWQCVAGIQELQQGRVQAAKISVVGCNQQAIGAQFASRV
jgi:3-oxoacyl-(acyl-carrier-protein) synthase